MPYRIETTESGRAEYLLAEPEILKSVTLDEDLFTRDSDGCVKLQPGTLLAKPSASDLWGPYDSTASDGRETATNNVLILHDYTVLDDGVNETDKVAAVLISGLVDGAKVILEDGTAITTAIRDALRSRLCTVNFGIGT